MRHIRIGLMALACATLVACGPGNSSRDWTGGGTPPQGNLKFVQGASFTQATAGNPASMYTATFQNSVATGDLIVLVFWWNYPTGANIVSVTDAGGNVYQQALVTPPNNNENAWVYYATEVSGGSAFSVTVQVSQTSANPFSMAALEYSGPTALDVTSTSSGSMTSDNTVASSGSATTNEANELILGVSLSGQQSGTVAGSGFASRFSSNYFMVEDKFVSSTGTYDAEFTYPNGCSDCTWQAGMATFY